MKHHSRFNIDPTKSFPHLDKAPIVEAVIEIRARAQTLWDEAAIMSQLKSRLPDYPNVLSLNAVRQEFTFGPEVTADAKTHELGRNGLRFQSADNKYVCQFNRDNFVFSRLQPYETWDNLHKEAMRLWQFHVEIAKPADSSHRQCPQCQWYQGASLTRGVALATTHFAIFVTARVTSPSASTPTPFSGRSFEFPC